MATLPATIAVSFPGRDGAIEQSWPLVRVTRTQIVAHNPAHVAGAVTRFRREDGRMVGDAMPWLTWRVTPAGLQSLVPAPSVDDHLRRISAFRTFADLERAHREHKYIPTIRTDDNAQPTDEDKAAARAVQEACALAGITYYDGDKLVGPDAPAPRPPRAPKRKMVPVCSVGGCWSPRVEGSEYCTLGPAHQAEARS